MLLAGGALAALLFGAATMPLAQAEHTSPAPVTSDYVVQPGDNAWNLSGQHLGDSRVWHRIVEENPILQQRGRVFTRGGVTYVMMKSGEHLQGLAQFGITTVPAQASANAAPPSSMMAVATDIHSSPFPQVPSWAWWILGVVMVGGAVFYLVRRMLLADPATSGPQMVRDGVNAETARVRFEGMAERQNFDILEQTAGRISGVMNVRYADGTERPRAMRDEPAFEARVRHQNGSIESLYMLQRCGNDLRYGGISRYLPGPEFRFVADQVAEAAPAPQPEPAAEVAPESVVETPREEAGPEVDLPDGTVKFEFRRGRGDQQNLIRLTGIEAEDITFERQDRTTTLRYTETPKPRTRKAVPAELVAG